ncbi:MAG: hypothetical protein ABI416_14440 [Ginsengibacter sp.]
MKIVFLLIAILFFKETVFSQWLVNENPLTIKELKLTKSQQKKIRRINEEASAQIKLLHKSGPGDEETAIKIGKIQGRRVKKIRSFLTPEQQLVWRQKLSEKKPRRGVTGLPNERTRR